ncbi:MAG TPA: type I methionyl aminopeptidase, partial [Gemmatimonadaceae bacterium]|nr:type I methionyl aminopeptidase [Gemmatimonadaceae bacterium]
MLHLKSSREIEIMARGGQLLARTLELLKRHVRPGISTKELDTVAEDFIRSHPGASAAFKGLYGFPGSVCISINEEIVHGIPSAKRILKEGDIVSLDFGVKLEGYFTDAAITVPVGEISAQDQRLLAVTQDALAAGVAAARVGNHIGDIGFAISSVVKAAGFTTADDLVGHYVGTKPHGDPQVPNVGKPKRGARLLAGLTIAIEPMVNIGGSPIRTLSDRWTVVTADGSR